MGRMPFGNFAIQSFGPCSLASLLVFSLGGENSRERLCVKKKKFFCVRRSELEESDFSQTLTWPRYVMHEILLGAAVINAEEVCFEKGSARYLLTGGPH